MGDHAPALLHQSFEQLEFGGRQMHVLAVAAHMAALEIDGETIALDHRRRSSGAP